jgi:vacuolar-type H+-ATPase subunit E/Vma4
MNAEKLEYFAEAIGREVEARKRRAKHQLANDLGKAAAAEIGAAEEKMQKQLEKTRREAQRESNKKIAAETARAKAAYFAAQESQRAELRREVAQELTAFANSTDYESYLIERILAAKSKHSFFAAVRLCSQGLQFAEKITQATGLATQPANPDCIGGFVLQNENGTIQLDCTFKTRLKEAMHE